MSILVVALAFALPLHGAARSTPRSQLAARPVATASELQRAIRAGEAHIVVTDHLDLSQITPDSGACFWQDSDGGLGNLGSLTDATQSLRVRTPRPSDLSQCDAACGTRVAPQT